MNRRDVLKIGGISALLLVAPVWKLADFVFSAPEAEYKGLFFRGQADGEIHVSTDQRQTWHHLVSFGSDLRVSKMYVGSDDRLHAQVKYQNMPFYLTMSEDGKNWLFI